MAETAPPDSEIDMGRDSFGAETPLKSMIDVVCKNSKSVKEGSLVLTNRRLVFAAGKSTLTPDEIKKVMQDRDAFSISLEQIANVTGNRGILRPSLQVIWRNAPEDQTTMRTDFIQNYRPKTLEEATNGINEWVSAIEGGALADGDLKSGESAAIVDQSELKSKVLEELGDMQWKGFFQIEKELREKFNLTPDPDLLEKVCAELVKEKRIEQDKYGQFFRKTPASGK